MRLQREPGSRVYHFAMLFWGLGGMVFDSSPAGANYLVLYTRVLSRDVPANAILSKNPKKNSPLLSPATQPSNQTAHTHNTHLQ